MEILFSIIILIFSVVIHEVAHGYAAERLGDPTAKYAGRLTINPIAHLDLMGSFIIPVLLVMTHAGFIFGWAKPVPVNPYNLRNQRWGEALVSAAGPLSNLLLAFIFGVVVRAHEALGVSAAFVELSMIIVVVNVALALFNMIPMPPLDGSKILFAVLGRHGFAVRAWFERYWILGIVIVIFVIFPLLHPLINIFFWAFTGVLL